MTIVLSVVSHGQGALVQNLFADLRRLAPAHLEIILTLNVPEDETWLAEWVDLPIRVIRNTTPRGFGANHNRAFAHSRSKLFCVVNPDIRLPDASFLELTRAFSNPQVASCAPLVLGPTGEVADSARRFPTLARIGRRIVLRQREADYSTCTPAEVEWTAGMFIMFRRDAFARIGGFDERYFMYLEDADICRRLRQAGWTVLFRPDSVVVHDAQRASHRNLQHLRWHSRSMIRFLTGI